MQQSSDNHVKTIHGLLQLSRNFYDSLILSLIQAIANPKPKSIINSQKAGNNIYCAKRSMRWKSPPDSPASSATS